MATRIALVMHSPLGAAFRDCAAHILGQVPDLHVFDVTPESDPQKERHRLLSWIQSGSHTQPVLLLCDLYGATPFNIAAQARQEAMEQGHMVHLLTGTNACMVLKALTDRSKDAASLSAGLLQGAVRGIVDAEPHSD